MPSDVQSTNLGSNPFPLVHVRGDEDEDGWSTDSSRSCCSDTTGLAALDLSALSAAGEVVHRARTVLQQASTPVPVAFEGDIKVQHSQNVTIGPSTHVHVTVVQPTEGHTPLPCDADGIQVQGDLGAGQRAVAGAAAPKTVVPDARSFLRRPSVVLSAMGLAAAVTTAVVLLLALQHRSSGVETLDNGVKLVKRPAWGALPPLEKPEVLRTPVDTVIIHHTGTESCFYFEHCVKRMRMMQNYHQGSAGKEDWNDIAYNFVVGGDGVVYEGRGWDAVGAHTKHWNRNTTCLTLIGNFTVERPTQAQRDMLRKLIQWGVEEGKIVKDGYRLVGACQVQANKSPGKAFMEDLRTWPGWWDYMWDSKACTE